MMNISLAVSAMGSISDEVETVDIKAAATTGGVELGCTNPGVRERLIT